ncbi:unnamed protein product [Rangifer tarandus platyrhynchus]|uniref:Uncharacterized protein n=2 Tax=Rangifer tarandus platyrhynchus TaxID=3082113 RepID=A0ABN8ZXE7_RANTA|nr:unnamed protein product [Rangifer tarandus platyrhynchus]CAI9711998.1 unnamed protein product [Rangifer tarandus platyrhynchus]
MKGTKAHLQPEKRSVARASLSGPSDPCLCSRDSEGRRMLSETRQGDFAAIVYLVPGIEERVELSKSVSPGVRGSDAHHTLTLSCCDL